VRVWADPDRLHQVIGNLVGNAIKYGRPGSDVEVRVAAKDGCAQVTVINEGEGIPPEELPHLFGKFHRTPAARAGQVSGLGLGLYITRGLVEAHGGRIWAESRPQKTCFHFTLPLSRGAGR
jgi:signal transduction histidine kinase